LPRCTNHKEVQGRWDPGVFCSGHQFQVKPRNSARYIERHAEPSQGKLVRVCSGRIRGRGGGYPHGAPTYKRWLKGQLSSGEYADALRAAGFAHGFARGLSENGGSEYKCHKICTIPPTNFTYLWDDPDDIGIECR